MVMYNLFMRATLLDEVSTVSFKIRRNEDFESDDEFSLTLKMACQWCGAFTSDELTVLLSEKVKLARNKWSHLTLKCATCPSRKGSLKIIEAPSGAPPASFTTTELAIGVPLCQLDIEGMTPIITEIGGDVWDFTMVDGEILEGVSLKEMGKKVSAVSFAIAHPGAEFDLIKFSA